MGQVRAFGWAWLLCAALGLGGAIPAVASAQPGDKGGTTVVNPHLQRFNHLAERDGETPETLSLREQMFELVDEGRYREARPIAERRLALLEKTLDPSSPWLANALCVAGYYWRMIGSFRRAEPLYQRALAIIEGSLGQTPEAVYDQRVFGQSKIVDYADVLKSLAELYQDQGDYARAEPVYQRLLSFWEAYDRWNGDPEGTSSAAILDQLGALYEGQQDYARAEAAFSRALAYRRKLRKPLDMSIAASLRNLGSLFRKRGDTAHAEPPLREALAIVEQESGPEAREVADIALTLAKLYASQQAYARAEPLLRRALAIRENDVWGTPPAVVAETLVDWARICLDNGDLKCTEERAQRALTTFERTLGPNHRRVAECLFTISDARAAQGDAAEAVRLSDRAAAIQDRDTMNLLAVGSELQRRAHLEMLQQRTSALVSLHAVSAPLSPAAKRLALTTILRRKGLVLDAMADSFSILRGHQDTAGKELLDQLAQVSGELSALASRGPGGIPPARYLANIEKLAAERQRLEGEIGHRSAEFRADYEPISVEQIQAAIPTSAALLKGFAYRPHRPKEPPDKRWGERRYAAYVLRRSGAVTFADLGEVAPIDAAVQRLRAALADPNLSHDPTPAARDLDQRVMQPIRPLLGDARQVLLSPDGALNLVPFAALAGEDGHPLIERYTFTYLTSGRELLRFTGAVAPPKSGAVVLADPAYGALDAPQAPDAHRGLLSPDMKRIKFGPLPGTGDEARSIAKLIPSARVLLGLDATERALRGLHGPRVLHIATNGFFLPSASHDAAPENPLLRAGLALAGANTRSSGDDDGILTALEAASLDLYGTRLVALSACETGLGDETDGDGVYGLRRALVIAGAETQVLSLWKVKDAPTKALMESYYRRLLRGDGRSEALRQAALEMLARPSTSHPNLWASFIVSGSDATLDGAPAPPPPLNVHARGCGCHVSAPGDSAASAAIAALLGLGAAARRKRKA